MLNVTDLGAITSVQQIMVAKARMARTLVMAPKSVRFRRHYHLLSVLFGDLLNHSYNITFSMFFLYLVTVVFDRIKIINYYYVFEEQLNQQGQRTI